MVGRLAGKRIIITGAVNNIGREAAQQFIAEGARVVVADIDAAAGRRTADELGSGAHFVKADVTKEEEVRDLIESGVAWLGGLDVLVQNAGIQHSGFVTDFDAAKWDALFAVNARAHFFGPNMPFRICASPERGRSSIRLLLPASVAVPV